MVEKFPENDVFENKNFSFVHQSGNHIVISCDRFFNQKLVFQKFKFCVFNSKSEMYELHLFLESLFKNK